MEERVRAIGHEHVTATHGSTFEVTTDEFLTRSGDCILAIGADRAPADFDPAFVAACRSDRATIEIAFRTGDCETLVAGRGDPGLTFNSGRSLVGRTSGFVDDRTVLVEADGAAADLPREFVDSLTRGEPLELVLRVGT